MKMLERTVKSVLAVTGAAMIGYVVGWLAGDSHAREEIWKQVIEKAENIKVVEV